MIDGAHVTCVKNEQHHKPRETHPPDREFLARIAAEVEEQRFMRKVEHLVLSEVHNALPRTVVVALQADTKIWLVAPSKLFV